MKSRSPPRGVCGRRSVLGIRDERRPDTGSRPPMPTPTPAAAHQRSTGTVRGRLARASHRRRRSTPMGSPRRARGRSSCCAGLHSPDVGVSLVEAIPRPGNAGKVRTFVPLTGRSSRSPHAPEPSARRELSTPLAISRWAAVRLAWDRLMSVVSLTLSGRGSSAMVVPQSRPSGWGRSPRRSGLGCAALSHK